MLFADMAGHPGCELLVPDKIPTDVARIVTFLSNVSIDLSTLYLSCTLVFCCCCYSGCSSRIFQAEARWPKALAATGLALVAACEGTVFFQAQAVLLALQRPSSQVGGLRKSGAPNIDPQVVGSPYTKPPSVM